MSILSVEKEEIFDTQKNPQEVALRWREEINKDYILDIEKKCTDSMDLLGYLPIGDQPLSSAKVLETTLS